MAFVNLEAALATGSAGWPTKDEVIHAAPLEVLDWLRSIGFDSLSLANNHTGDLGPGALLDALGAVSERGFLHAGAGVDRARAALPGSRPDRPVPLWLVAVSTGQPPVAGAALDPKVDLPGRPGVNALRVRRELGADPSTFEALRHFVESTGHGARIRRDVTAGRRKPLPDDSLDLFGTPVRQADTVSERYVADPEDRERLLAACRAASAAGAHCVVSIHNHAWPPDWSEVPDWLSDLAHRCVDSGAVGVFAHGAPATGPIEIYRDRPILYGLGNLVFHTARPDGYPGPDVWRGFVFDGQFSSSGQLTTARILPITIDREGPDRGFPCPASEATGEAILERVAQQSQPWGTSVVVSGQDAGTISWTRQSRTSGQMPRPPAQGTAGRLPGRLVVDGQHGRRSGQRQETERCDRCRE